MTVHQLAGFCECGCGQPVRRRKGKQQSRFLRGHNHPQRTRPRPYPFAPIDEATTLADHDLAARLHISGWQLRRCRAEGCTVEEADRFAVRLGLHPCELWGWGWFADALTPMDDLYVNHGGWRVDWQWRHPEYA